MAHPLTRFLRTPRGITGSHWTALLHEVHSHSWWVFLPECSPQLPFRYYQYVTLPFSISFINSYNYFSVNKYNYRYLPWADQLEVMHKHVPQLRDTDAFFVRKLIDPSMGDVIAREVLAHNLWLALNSSSPSLPLSSSIISSPPSCTAEINTGFPFPYTYPYIYQEQALNASVNSLLAKL